ncbi:hypothetical protein CONCODRAFT_158108, partial [Conidiobolus coronatus NRRL 28638]
GKNIEKVLNEEYEVSDNNSSYLVNSSLDLPFTEYTKLFNGCIEKFRPYIKCVKFGKYSNHYQLLEVSRVFFQLSKLSISNTKISLMAFQKALSNLKYLKSFSMHGVSFLHYNGDPESIKPIILPNTLKHLDWQSCKVLHTVVEEDPQSASFDYFGSESVHSMFQFQPDYFSKLKLYSSYLLDEYPFNMEILRLNPQLTYLKLWIGEFNETSVSIISLIHNVKNLELYVDRLNFNLKIINFSLPNLTCLRFYRAELRVWPLIEKLALSSPNLSELRIEIGIYTDPNIIELVNNLPNLKKLAIQSYFDINPNFEDFRPGPKFEYLELHVQLNVHPILNKLAQYPNFKAVIFNKSFFELSSLLIQDQENTAPPWKLINTQKFIKYYKLS